MPPPKTDETTILRRRTTNTVRDHAAPTLTILYHPDLRRIGECARLERLGRGAETIMSRSDLAFRRPGTRTERSLDTRWISREPVRFTGAPGGGVRVSFDPAKLDVIADGAAIDGGLECPESRLRTGVVLLVSDAVGLLLHNRGTVPATPRPDFGLVGDSTPIVRLRKQIGQVAEVDAPVLLLGESGTGKELVATAIHANSPRAAKPLIPLNMASIPSELAAAELFGYERGAFSGATVASTARPRSGTSGSRLTPSAAPSRTSFPTSS